MFHHRFLWFRSCIIGYIIGLIPGIGGETAVFVAYGQAKQTSRNPERFGSGIVEGIIAPESASNAKEGGALLTTLVLGIPGSATMALLIGALLLQNVIPGPEMLRNELELTFTLLWGLALANVIGGILCYLLVGYINLTLIVTIAPRYLVPAILSLVFVGAYVYDKNVEDIVVTLIFTGLGLLMENIPATTGRHFCWALLLGSFFEIYFWLAYQTNGTYFFLTPGSLVILSVIFFSFCVEPVRQFIDNRRIKRTGS